MIKRVQREGIPLVKNLGSKLASSPNLELFPVHSIESHAQVPLNAIFCFSNGLPRMNISMEPDPGLLLMKRRFMLGLV